MYSFKKLSHTKDLIAFKTAYSQSFSARSRVAKRELQLEELCASDFVYALYKNDKLFAGFILNYFPGRCLGDYSSIKQQDIVNNLGANKVCELVGIWKDSQEKNPVSTLLMWALIIFKTLTLGRAYIFGCNRSEKIGNDYYYQADLQLVSAPGSELAVFYYTRKQFFMTFINSLLKFMKKGKKVKKESFNRTNEVSV